MQETQKVIMYEYDLLDQETLAEIKARFPQTYAEAEKAVNELMHTMVFLSHENKLLAKDMFLKGFLVGRHGRRIS